MAAIIAAVSEEDMDGISHGGRPVWFKNNKYAGCYLSVTRRPLDFCHKGFFLLKSDRPFSVSRSCCSEALWFNGKDCTVWRMWAILLGCVLREGGKEGRSRRRKRRREGGESEKNTFSGGLRAIMQYCRKVYWMCLTINNQFIRT